MAFKNPIELHVIMAEIVDSIRDTSTITGVVADGVYFRYTADNSLSKNDFISITDDTTTHENIKILEADSTSFVIKTEYSTANIFKANAPYFDHEKAQREAEILTNKGKKGHTVAWQRFPLVYLEHPYTTDRENNILSYSLPFNLRLLNNTKSEYYSDDRFDKNYYPILFPIYEDIINAMAESKYFAENDPYYIAHSKTNQLNLDGNPFPDKLDGVLIEFSDIEINALRACEPETIPIKRTLTTSVNDNTGGIISPDSGQRDNNEVVRIITAPDNGYELVETIVNEGEIDEFKTSDAYFDLTMDSRKTAKAFFKEVIIDLIFTNILLNGIGDVSPNDGVYKYNSEIELACVVDYRFDFKEWNINGDIQINNPYIFIITEDTDVTAELTPKDEFLQFPNNILNLTEILDIDKVLAL
jgi:hypothetical protein